MMKRYYIIVEGRVQGVGFRYFVQSIAAAYGLTGWVRNLDNGFVDMEVQGSEALIDKFMTAVRKGNHFIRVDDYSMKPIALGVDTKFKIRY
ncbi:acylphosphatase [Eubacterium sp. 1001713B170207_170306_E7]|uniref:acylphosphatase n=1 Tax=Eubacterium sp. 1001713B170207_170306_E7 TaxID=2787097 RepID=UPI00325FA097